MNTSGKKHSGRQQMVVQTVKYLDKHVNHEHCRLAI